MKILSNILFRYNLIIISLIGSLNYFFVKRKLKKKTRIIINSQYTQRYTLLEVIFGIFLKFIGNDVKGLVCAGYDYCEQAKTYQTKPNCNDCRKKTFKIFRAAKIDAIDLANHKDKVLKNVISFNNFDFEKIKFSKDDQTGYPIGETFYWNWLHYSNGFLIPNSDIETKKILYKIYITTVGSFYTLKKSIEEYNPDLAITCNGKFSQTRPVFFLKNFYNYTCMTWEHFANPDDFVWIKHKCAVDQIISNYWNNIKEKKLTNEQSSEIKNDFAIHKTGKKLKWDFLKNIDLESKDNIFEKLQLDASKPIISLYLNTSWDSACLSHGLENLNFYETADFIIKNAHSYDNLQFVIRAHPAEINLPDFLKVSVSINEVLRNINKSIPKNVTLIDANSSISSYKLCSISDEALFFSSTLGLEMLYQKKRVTTLGGRCYYSNKGFTHDIMTKNELLDFFNNIDKDFRINGKRGQMKDLTVKEKEMVNVLAHYIRFQLHSHTKIVKRGILILTVSRYKNYIKYCNNLANYFLNNKMPFNLGK